MLGCIYLCLIYCTQKRGGVDTIEPCLVGEYSRCLYLCAIGGIWNGLGLWVWGGSPLCYRRSVVMLAKLLIDVGVELLHHEDQDDILILGVPYDRTLSACIGLHGTGTIP